MEKSNLFGEALRHIMAGENITSRQLAETCGFSEFDLPRILSGVIRAPAKIRAILERGPFSAAGRSELKAAYAEEAILRVTDDPECEIRPKPQGEEPVKAIEANDLTITLVSKLKNDPQLDRAIRMFARFGRVHPSVRTFLIQSAEMIFELKNPKNEPAEVSDGSN